MAKFLSALLSVVAGFFLAHLVDTTPQGKMIFARIDATVNSFLSGVRDAYRS